MVFKSESDTQDRYGDGGFVWGNHEGVFSGIEKEDWLYHADDGVRMAMTEGQRVPSREMTSRSCGRRHQTMNLVQLSPQAGSNR